MAKITQPHGAWFQQPYGGFAGKAAADNPAGPHNPGIITQPHGAWFSRRYGSFAGKAAGVGAPARRTRPILLLRDTGRLAPGL